MWNIRARIRHKSTKDSKEMVSDGIPVSGQGNPKLEARSPKEARTPKIELARMALGT
jgi:hypothetical protein